MIHRVSRPAILFLVMALCVGGSAWANSLSVTSAAALFNTTPQANCSGDGQPGPCGLQVDVTPGDSSPAFVETNAPAAETGVRVSFWLDPNSQKKGLSPLDMDGGQNIRVLKMLSTFPKPANASSVEHVVMFIKRNFLDNNYRIRVMAQQNFGFFATCAESFFVLDGGPAKKVTIEWVQGQGAQGSQNGRCSVFIDDVLIGEKTNLNTSEFNVNAVRLGFFQPSTPATTTGTYFLDEVVISRL